MVNWEAMTFEPLTDIEQQNETPNNLLTHETANNNTPK